MKGIVMSGIQSDLVINPVVEAIAFPCVRFVITLHRNNVPPEPIMLIATPTRMISVLSLKAKNPMIRDIITPVAKAASSPKYQVFV